MTDHHNEIHEISMLAIEKEASRLRAEATANFFATGLRAVTGLFRNESAPNKTA